MPTPTPNPDDARALEAIRRSGVIERFLAEERAAKESVRTRAVRELAELRAAADKALAPFVEKAKSLEQQLVEARERLELLRRDYCLAEGAKQGESHCWESRIGAAKRAIESNAPEILEVAVERLQRMARDTFDTGFKFVDAPDAMGRPKRLGDNLASWQRRLDHLVAAQHKVRELVWSPHTEESLKAEVDAIVASIPELGGIEYYDSAKGRGFLAGIRGWLIGDDTHVPEADTEAGES